LRLHWPYPDLKYLLMPRQIRLRLEAKHAAREIFDVRVIAVIQAFSLRLALYELDRLVKNGMSREDFERTRSLLGKYINVLTKTKSAELGYAIDSVYYGIPNYNEYMKAALAKLTLEDVNRAIRNHLRAENLQIVGVAKDAAGLAAQLTGNEATPVRYNSSKPQEILDEDKIVEKWPLRIRRADITVTPVGEVFER